MDHPKTGMRYEQAIRTATRHAKEGSRHIVESMANQVATHEGIKAAKEFVREATSKGIEQRGKMYFS